MPVATRMAPTWGGPSYVQTVSFMFGPPCARRLSERGPALALPEYFRPRKIGGSFGGLQNTLAAQGAGEEGGEIACLFVEVDRGKDELDGPFRAEAFGLERVGEAEATDCQIGAGGAAAVKLEGGKVLAPTVEFLTSRGIPVMAHVGLTPQAVNILGGYGVRGKSPEEAKSIVEDAMAMSDAGAFAMVIEGVLEPIAIEITQKVACPTIGIGASAQCDGQVLVAEDMLGLFDRVPKFVKKFGNMGVSVEDAVREYAARVRDRSFPGPDQLYQPV